jgi:outer membrane immunogenic protein
MKSLFISAAAIALSVSAAAAADLPTYEAPPAALPVPAFSWTGFYLGVDAGWGFGKSEVNIGGPDDEEFDVDGWLAGGFGGYNYQFTGSPVAVGIEADVEATGIDGNTTDPVFGGVDTEVKVQGSARSRLGYAFDRLLPYVTSGFAWAKPDADSAAAGEADDDVEWGWTVGAGVDYAVTDRFFVRAEYRFTDLGDFDNDDKLGEVEDLRTHTVRIGAGAKF